MKRIFTDPRMPGFEIHNNGDAGFTIMRDGEELDTFTAYEDVSSETISEEFAARQAQAWFDYAAEREMEPEEEEEEDEGGVATAPPRPPKTAQPSSGVKRTLGVNFEPDDAQRVSSPAPARSLDSLIPAGEVMSAEDVDRLVAAARAETDPKKRAQLRQQALSAMQQQESLAQRLARTMLG